MPAYKLNVSGVQGFDPSKLAAVLQVLLPALMQVLGLFGGGAPTVGATAHAPSVTCEPLDDDE